MGGFQFIGRVVSNRMQKTVVVAVNYVVWVPKYKVYEKRTSRHFAHDEKQACNMGDVVRIQLTRKISKHKAYRVVDTLSQTPVYTRERVQQVVAERAARPVPSLVEAAEERLRQAQARLQKLRVLMEAQLGSSRLAAIPTPSSTSSTPTQQQAGRAS